MEFFRAPRGRPSDEGEDVMRAPRSLFALVISPVSTRRGALRRAVSALAVGLGLLSAPAARADDADSAPSEFTFGLRASGFYGPISGYTQVPLGGNPGTTSPRRPTLKELGIDDAAFYEVTGLVGWRSLSVFAGYSGLELDGSGTLSESLVSHGVSFAAGSPFKSATQLNVINFGGGWRFDLDQRRLQLFPKIDVAILDFSYSLDSPGAHAARAYRTTAVRLGAEGSLDLGHGFALELDGAASLPISHMPQLASVTGRIAYRLFPASPVRTTLFLGCAGRWIDFEDSQTVPNHISIRSGPLLTGGFSIAF
jgi:hypothetical protein